MEFFLLFCGYFVFCCFFYRPAISKPYIGNLIPCCRSSAGSDVPSPPERVISPRPDLANEGTLKKKKPFSPCSRAFHMSGF